MSTDKYRYLYHLSRDMKHIHHPKNSLMQLFSQVFIPTQSGPGQLLISPLSLYVSFICPRISYK